LRARQGKLKAIKLGRTWFTKKEWLEEYIKRTEEYKAKRKKHAPTQTQIQTEKQPQTPKPQKETLSKPLLVQKPQTQLFLPKPVSVLLSLFVLASVLSFTLTLAYPSSPFLSSLKFTFTPFSHSPTDREFETETESKEPNPDV